MATGYSGSINLGSDSYRGSIAIGSDELIDFSCTPCYDRQNVNVEAQFYCPECDTFCCLSCKDFHNSFKANKTHKVLGREDIDQWGQQDGGAQLPLEICPDHPGEILKLICLNDKKLCCSVCAALSHRTCPCMTYIPKIALGIKASPDLSIVDNTLNRFIKLAEEMVESDEKANTSLDQSKTNYIDTLKNIRQQVDDFFSNLESKANTEIDKFHAEKHNELQQHKKAVNDTKNNLTQHFDAIQPSSTNNESQLFIKMFTAQEILPEMKLELQKLADSPQTVSFCLEKDKKLQEIFTTIESLGKIKDETTTVQRKLQNIIPLPLLDPKQPSPPSPPSPRQQSSQLVSTTPAATTTTTTTTTASGKTCKQQQNQLLTATNRRDINVKMKSDKYNCDMYGSCQMPNDQILLTDNANKKVKRLNTKYEPSDYVKLPASPYAICCIGDAEAVVTCDNKTIYFLSITKSKMSVARSIKLGHYCYGIAYYNERLFVSDQGNKVYIHKTSGKCIKTVQKDNNGVDMFQRAEHICVSPDGSKIYVAAFDEGLVTLDSKGNLLSIYSKDLTSVRGVCVDRQGRVLICGLSLIPAYNCLNVPQLDEGGTTRVGWVVVNEGCTDCEPVSICIDNHNSTLICTVNTENLRSHFLNFAKVFDLK